MYIYDLFLLVGNFGGFMGVGNNRKNGKDKIVGLLYFFEV